MTVSDFKAGAYTGREIEVLSNLTKIVWTHQDPWLSKK